MDHRGKVLEVSSRVVKLETLDGRLVILSNVSVLADPLVVFTKRPERRSELIVGLAYGTDLDRIPDPRVGRSQTGSRGGPTGSRRSPSAKSLRETEAVDSLAFRVSTD